MTETSAHPRADTRPGPYRWRWIALAVILSAEVMDLLDATVTNIAGPSIRADLGGSYTSLQWLGAAYTLAMAVGLITGGRLGDIYGRRRLFLLGTAGFTAASLACALAQGPGTLIGFRAVQGAFGAVLIPQGLGLIKEMFDESETAAAFGVFGPVMGLSAVGGPILAGWLIDADFFGTGWRMIFLINLPLGLAALAAGLRFLPESRSPRATRLDPVGALLATLGSVLVVYPLVQGRELDWPAWTFAMMAGAVLVFAIFAWYERRVERAGGDPLVAPDLFRTRAFSGGLLFGTVFFAGMVGYSLVFNLFAQLGLGYSPLKAGLAGAPWALGMVVGFGATQALARRHGRISMQIGTLVMAAGVVGMYGTLHWAGLDITVWQLVPSLLVTGFGMSMVMAPFFDIVLAGVRPHQTGSAAGSLTAVQQLGGALGIALLGTLFFGVLGGQAAEGADAVTPRVRAELAAAGVPAGAADRIVAGLRACAEGRAATEDPQHVPAGCTAAAAAVRSAAAADPAAAGRIAAAVADGGREAAKRGFIGSLERTLVLELALMALACGLTLLLPRHAREDGPAVH